MPSASSANAPLKIAPSAAHNAKIRLARGAKITGKKGAISGEANFEIDATGATVDGGAGPGLSAFLGARVVFREGTLKGIPAFVFDRPPLVLDLAGTRIEGEQQKTRGH